MTMIDNGKGVGMQLAVLGRTPVGADSMDEYNNLLMENSDHFIFGESEIPDCPGKETPGDYCNKFDKFAVWPGAAATKGKVPHETALPQFPMYKIKGDNCWGGASEWKRITFKNFKGLTREGFRNTIFGSSVHQPDYTPMMLFTAPKFENVENDAFASMMSPLEEWATIIDCGNFPCTAPNNILYYFKWATWTGTRPSTTAKNF